MTFDPDNPTGLSASLLNDVDRICLRFENAWRQGERPDLHEYLAASPPTAQAELLRELLLLDIDYRSRGGEQPLSVDYTAMFSDQTPLIESVFAHIGPKDTADDRIQQAIFSTTNTPLVDQPVPTRLGRYRVIERIGAGGFGSVYKAHDDQLQRDVAIKVPHQKRFRSEAEHDLFLHEARVLATLRHPAIVPVYDVGFSHEDESSCYVVSQFMEGGDLAAYLRHTQPAAKEAARFVIRVADALHHAHGRGLVHRDVKLSNILRDAEGNVYIADFGLALRDEDVGSGSGFAGTPANMSPEQARGEGHLVDGRTDVYGLGGVLYELLTGVRPFGGKSVSGLLRQIESHDPKPLRQWNDSIPQELERICLKAMAKRPADRYTTALDMAEDLRAWSHATDKVGHVDGASPVRVSFMRRPVIVATVGALAILASIWFAFGGSLTKQSAIPITQVRSIAVLPFKPMMAQEQMDYLGLGMADALITKLSNLRQLEVRPTGSIRRYLDDETDPLTAGRALHVDAVLDGSIQQSQDRTRATVRLLRVSDGKSLWSGTFEEASADLFAVQDAISEKVTVVLALELSSQELTRLKRRATESPTAYEAYVKGRYHWNQRYRGGVREAIDYYKQAVDADPLYALAYAGLAESYALMSFYNFYMIDEAFPSARAAAMKALELDPELTEAHAALAYVTFYHDWDWDRAEREFKRAIELSPNYATAHQWYGEFLMYMDRADESITELRRAAKLDPLSPVIHSMLGSPYLYDRQPARAREEYQNSLQLHPKSGIALCGLAMSYYTESRYEESLAMFEQAHDPPRRRSATATAWIAYLQAVSGQRSEARRTVEELESAPTPKRFSPFHIACIYAGLGETDAALDWLRTAYEQRDERIATLKVEPRLDGLRSDARFNEFLAQLGLAD